MTPTGPKEATAPSASPSPSSDEPGAEAATALRIEAWGRGGSRSLAGLEALAEADGDPASRYWVDLADPSPELTQAVARRLGLHPLVAEDIEETAHNYLKDSRVIGDNHTEPLGAYPVESYIAPCDFEITDGEYGTLTAAVEEGRRIYANLQRASRYLLLCSLSNIGLMAGAIALRLSSARQASPAAIVAFNNRPGRIVMR